jgi:hypothetical protein
MTTYRIRDWAKNFENSRSRVIGALSWVPVPNKHDGEGFRTIMNHERGIVIYGCWNLILQVASKCTPRGTLVKGDGTPHTAESIALKAGWRQVGDIRLTLDFCSTPQVGWIEALASETSGGCQAGDSALLTNRTEWNGMEGTEGREQTTTTEGGFEASHPEFKQLTESMEFRCVTHEQYLLILKAHPAVDRQAAITRALSDAVLETSGISAPAKFMKERFRRLEMDGQTVRPENETREQRAERLDRAIRRGAR